MSRIYQTQRLRAIDLFCGAGGSSWGAQAAGAQIIAGFDSWALAGRNHAANFPRSRFFEGRLEKLDVNAVARQIGSVDLILASPECTNHSPARGNKPRCEDRRKTAFQVVRFAGLLRPRWIVVENVVSMRRWACYLHFKRKLDSLGYRIREEVLNAADFGVPQTRRRLFLLCDRDRQPDPTPTVGGRWRSAGSIVERNGRYEWSPLRTSGRAWATLKRAERGIEALGANKTFLLVYYGSDRAGGWQHLRRPLRTITTLDRFAVVRPTPRGHVMRMLQVPELQAAMGMHDMILPHGTRRDRIKMIGNAVCPPVMQHVVAGLVGAGTGND
jgi:DNA (cytosine-5)-methyltransferase 1